MTLDLIVLTGGSLSRFSTLWSVFMQSAQSPDDRFMSVFECRLETDLPGLSAFIRWIG